MPISLAYEVEQDATHVLMKVPLHAVDKAKLDITLTSAYVSISVPPHFLQLDFAGDVDPDQAKARMRKGVLHFTIPKVEPGVWDEIQAQGTKSELMQRRQTAWEALQAKNAQVAEEKRRKEEEAAHAAAQADVALRNRKRQEERDALDADVRRAMEQLAQHTPLPPAAEAVPEQILPPTRRGPTASVETSFTKRRAPFPARETNPEHYEGPETTLDGCVGQAEQAAAGVPWWERDPKALMEKAE
ncbi:hypothetical protein KIPB_012548, partial [Kipferlia bialata]|eukprot:g12548.t1